jgi:trk system potassium uptake protein TrkA
VKIIIAGAGKVGFELARALSSAHHVAVIDKNAEALERLHGLIDILPVIGDVEDPETYESLFEGWADIFVAVTDSDEANLLSTLIVKESIAVEKILIRLRNSFFAKGTILEKLEVTRTVFPFVHSAETIRLLLEYPEANNVKRLAGSSARLISIEVDNPDFEEKPIAEFESESVKVIGIERNKQFIVPSCDESIVHSDLLYFLGKGEVVERHYSRLDLKMPRKIKYAVVFGAHHLGLEIAKVLTKEGVKVKVVEKDLEYCKKASEVLQEKALVINSHYDEAILYEEENLLNADMVIMTGSHDEENIVRSLQAKEYGIPKVVAINNEKKYYDLMHRLGIIVARGPRSTAYYDLLEMIASKSVISEKHFCGGRGIILSRKIYPKSILIGKAWDTLAFKASILLLEKNGILLAPVAGILLEEGDMIFLVVSADDEEEGKRWISSL